MYLSQSMWAIICLCFLNKPLTPADGLLCYCITVIAVSSATLKEMALSQYSERMLRHDLGFKLGQNIFEQHSSIESNME